MLDKRLIMTKLLLNIPFIVGLILERALCLNRLRLKKGGRIFIHLWSGNPPIKIYTCNKFPSIHIIYALPS